MSFSRPIQWYHSHSDPIWPDGTSTVNYSMTVVKGESECMVCGITKGVGPSTTLAWPGWKQPEIAVEVDTARLEMSRFKKCYVNCVLL
jgi:hypothetical protein